MPSEHAEADHAPFEESSPPETAPNPPILLKSPCVDAAVFADTPPLVPSPDLVSQDSSTASQLATTVPSDVHQVCRTLVGGQQHLTDTMETNLDRDTPSEEPKIPIYSTDNASLVVTIDPCTASQSEENAHAHPESVSLALELPAMYDPGLEYFESSRNNELNTSNDNKGVPRSEIPNNTIGGPREISLSGPEHELPCQKETLHELMAKFSSSPPLSPRMLQTQIKSPELHTESMTEFSGNTIPVGDVPKDDVQMGENTFSDTESLGFVIDTYGVRSDEENNQSPNVNNEDFGEEHASTSEHSSAAGTEQEQHNPDGQHNDGGNGCDEDGDNDDGDNAYDDGKGGGEDSAYAANRTETLLRTGIRGEKGNGPNRGRNVPRSSDSAVKVIPQAQNMLKDETLEAWITERHMRERPSRTLFVRNVYFECTETELREHFSRFGAIRDFFSKISSRGIAFITFYDLRHSQAAKEALNNVDIGPRKVDVHYSLPRDTVTPTTKCDATKNQGTVYVVLEGDDANSITEESIRRHFSQYGEVKAVNQTRVPSGQKFVEFYDSRAAQAALEGPSYGWIDGSKITLEYAWDKSTKQAVYLGIRSREKDSTFKGKRQQPIKSVAGNQDRWPERRPGAGRGNTNRPGASTRANYENRGHDVHSEIRGRGGSHMGRSCSIPRRGARAQSRDRSDRGERDYPVPVNYRDPEYHIRDQTPRVQSSSTHALFERDPGRDRRGSSHVSDPRIHRRSRSRSPGIRRTSDIERYQQPQPHVPSHHHHQHQQHHQQNQHHQQHQQHHQNQHQHHQHQQQQPQQHPQQHQNHQSHHHPHGPVNSSSYLAHQSAPSGGNLSAEQAQRLLLAATGQIGYTQPQGAHIGGNASLDQHQHQHHQHQQHQQQQNTPSNFQQYHSRVDTMTHDHPQQQPNQLSYHGLHSGQAPVAVTPSTLPQTVASSLNLLTSILQQQQPQSVPSYAPHQSTAAMTPAAALSQLTAIFQSLQQQTVTAPPTAVVSHSGPVADQLHRSSQASQHQLQQIGMNRHSHSQNQQQRHLQSTMNRQAQSPLQVSPTSLPPQPPPAQNIRQTYHHQQQQQQMQQQIQPQPQQRQNQHQHQQHRSYNRSETGYYQGQSGYPQSNTGASPPSRQQNDPAQSSTSQRGGAAPTADYQYEQFAQYLAQLQGQK